MWQFSDAGSRDSPVSMHFVRCAIGKARERGLAWRELLRSSRIDPDSIDDPRAHVPFSRYAALEMQVMQALQDEALGYARRIHRPGGWAMACRAAVHPGSLGQALRRLLRCYSFFDWGPTLDLIVDGDDAVITAAAHQGPEPYEAFTYERTLLAMHRFACWLLDDDIGLHQVSFEHHEPAYVAEYRWLFGATTLQFDAPCASLRFDARRLDSPIRQDDRRLEALLQGGAYTLLRPQRDAVGWTTRLRERLVHRLPHLPEFEEIAAELAMHPQTLRRRLADEGVTFKALKDRVRRDAAEYYLRQHAHSIEEVAFRCGFSEGSALIRAFKRWNGVTPQAYAARRTPLPASLVATA